MHQLNRRIHARGFSHLSFPFPSQHFACTGHRLGSAVGSNGGCCLSRSLSLHPPEVACGGSGAVGRLGAPEAPVHVLAQQQRGVDKLWPAQREMRNQRCSGVCPRAAAACPISTG
jgi:hypothetical protein